MSKLSRVGFIFGWFSWVKNESNGTTYVGDDAVASALVVPKNPSAPCPCWKNFSVPCNALIPKFCAFSPKLGIHS